MARSEYAPTLAQFNLLIDACVREAVRGNSFAVQQGLAAVKRMKDVRYVYVYACMICICVRVLYVCKCMYVHGTCM